MITKKFLERDEQKAVAGWLDAIGVVWTHIAHERISKPDAKGFGYLNSLKRQGMKKGVPDNLIFTPAPLNGKPTAFELKRQNGGKMSLDQQVWIDSLSALGWNAACLHGSEMAIAWLRGLGYRPGVKISSDSAAIR